MILSALKSGSTKEWLLNPQRILSKVNLANQTGQSPPHTGNLSQAASISVDMEMDCPPFLSSSRGITEGLPRLLNLLSEEKIHATFFTTGELARNWPDAIRSIVEAGHELACHGNTHRSFKTLSAAEAREEIQRSTEALNRFSAPVSFRAPFLEFPNRYLPLLTEFGYVLDSSVARYKYPFRVRSHIEGLRRVPVSVTSSLLRLPEGIRDPILLGLTAPVTLYVHPWEFADLRAEALRLDCRFRTGPKAVRCLRTALRLLRQHGARFYRMRDLPG